MSENEKSVQLIENFVSWQGEGVDSGRPMIILRFKYCNLKCRWCDTRVKMRISSEAPHKLIDIQNKINETKAGLLITGGEPTLKRHFNDTLMLLNNLFYPIANVESNGHDLINLINSIQPNKVINFIYSPKIFNTYDLQASENLTNELYKYANSNNINIYIKLVYEDNDLINDYVEFLSEKIDMIWNHKIWLMPEGNSREQLIVNSGKVFDICEKYHFCFSSRNHIIYGFI